MRGRIIWGAIILGALVFSLQAGEYSTFDIVRQQRRLTLLVFRADSMQRAIDSLTVAERRVRTDPATQERIAREEFGMVNGSEILYRFIPDTDTAKSH